MLVGAVGIELLIQFPKSRVVTVLPTANQMNWSQMELKFVVARHFDLVSEESRPPRPEYTVVD
jgi:hypothetical protein